jgi:hypothetical protein
MHPEAQKMDTDLLIGTTFVLLLTLIVAGVILLFPISRKLGQLIDLRVMEKKGGLAGDPDELRRLGERLAEVEDQLKRLADRQEFTDQLLARRGEVLESGRRDVD